MAGLLAILGFAMLGFCSIAGGIQVMRNGMEISKGNRLTGPGATALGIVLIVVGVALPVGLAVFVL